MTEDPKGVSVEEPRTPGSTLQCPLLDRALAHAVAMDDLASVRALLADGADVNARSDEGETVLMTAAQSGRTAIVQCLITAGADLEARDRWGRTALTKADQHGHEAIFHLLKQAGASD